MIITPDIQSPTLRAPPNFPSLYEEYRPKVLSYFSARLKCFADAEDCCEDVFEKILRKLHTYDPAKAGVNTWIYSIARYRFIDFLRGRRQWQELTEEIPLDGDISDDLIERETLAELRDAEQKLPPELYEIVRLHYNEGLPLTEIASRIGLSYGATKLRHNKALTILRQTMPS